MAKGKHLLYKHALLATDLSKQNDLLIKRATTLAKKLDAKLSMAHVIEHAVIAYGGEFSLPIEMELETSLKKRAGKILMRLGKKYGVPKKRQYLLEGSVKNALTCLAKKISADLIIVGAYQHHHLGALLGSQASAILHAAKSDVWVIRIDD